MIITPMKSRVLKKLLVLFALLFTFHFLLFTSLCFASYPTSLKNGFIDDESWEEQQQNRQENDSIGNNRVFFNKGFHVAVSVGFCDGIYDSDHNPGLISRLFLRYWFNDRFGIGLEGGYHNLFDASNGNHNLIRNNIFVSPDVSVGIISRPKWGIFFNLGIGSFLENNAEKQSRYDWSSNGTVSFNFGTGIYFRIKRNIEMGMNFDIKMMIAQGDTGPDWGGSVPFILFSASPFIGYVF